MKRRLLLAVAAVSVFIFMAGLTGCGGGSGSVIQTEPLTTADMPMVLSAKDQSMGGETGTISFKMKLYDVNAVSPVGAPVDYPMEFRRRSATVGVTLWDGMTGEWRYSFAFPVIKGEVSPQMEGLKPGEYTLSISVNSDKGHFTFFSGEGTVRVAAGKNNFARIYLDVCRFIYANIAVSGLPESVVKSADSFDVQTTATAIGGETRNGYAFGYAYEGQVHFGAELPLYPEVAARLEYSLQGKDGKAYIQEFDFDILNLIDRIIENNEYPVVYAADTDLTIGFVFPGGYVVSLAPGMSSEKRILEPGSVGLEMMKLNVWASEQPKAIQRIDLALQSTSQAMSSSIAMLYVYDGAILLGSAPINPQSDQCSILLSSALRVAVGEAKTLSVKMDSVPKASFQASPGDRIRAEYLGSSGVNLTTGEEVKDATPLGGQITMYITELFN